MAAFGYSLPMNDEALGVVSGGSDLGARMAETNSTILFLKFSKVVAHYAAVGLGHVMDADTYGSPYHKSIPALVDKVMNKII